MMVTLRASCSQRAASGSLAAWKAKDADAAARRRTSFFMFFMRYSPFYSVYGASAWDRPTLCRYLVSPFYLRPAGSEGRGLCYQVLFLTHRLPPARFHSNEFTAGAPNLSGRAG